MTFLLIVLAIVIFAPIGAYLNGFLRITEVKEATVIAFEHLGEFCCCEMAWQNHHFDSTGDVKVGGGPKTYGYRRLIWRFGGYVIYIWPFTKPVKYLDWSDADGFGDNKFLTCLGDRTSDLVVKNAQTADPENWTLPIVSFEIVRRVVNPYKYLYVAPKGAAKQINERVETSLRAWIKSGSQEHAQEVRGNGAKLWDDLKTEPLNQTSVFDRIQNDWGMEVVRDSMVIKEVVAPASIQKALEAKKEQELLAQGEAEKIGAIDKAMANWVKSQKLGETEPDAEAIKRLKSDGSYDRKHQDYMNLMLSDEGSLNIQQILVGNPDGTQFQPGDQLGPAIGLFTAAFANKISRNGNGKGKQGNRGNRNDGGQNNNNGSSNKPPEEMDGEELVQWAEKQKKNKGRD